MELNKVYLGNSLEVVKTLPDESVNCVITSPPYYGLRDYGVDGQIGLEESPQRYIEKMVGLFREIRRVLKQDGTIWVNLGDSYCVDADGEMVVRNKRDVWNVNVKPNKEAHFATYPEMLIRPCVLAGCPEGGVILDPFMGSGTTGIVARKLNRNFVGIELNPEYQQMATRRICEHGENLFNYLND